MHTLACNPVDSNSQPSDERSVVIEDGAGQSIRDSDREQVVDQAGNGGLAAASCRQLLKEPLSLL
jgi:hypothetical protein